MTPPTSKSLEKYRTTKGSDGSSFDNPGQGFEGTSSELFRNVETDQATQTPRDNLLDWQQDEAAEMPEVNKKESNHEKNRSHNQTVQTG